MTTSRDGSESGGPSGGDSDGDAMMIQGRRARQRHEIWILPPTLPLSKGFARSWAMSLWTICSTK